MAYSLRDKVRADPEFPTEPVQFYPDGIIIRVYGSSEEFPELRGMVRVNYMGYIGYATTEESTSEEILAAEYQGSFETDAYLGNVGHSYKPTTEEVQTTTTRINNPMNQQYGVIAPPRIGDRVLVAHFGGDKWIIMQVFPAHGGNEQPPHDEHDLSFIHRSGSSVRFNDRYPSTQSGLPEESFDGISGHMTLVGNRVMFLSGDKFLPHGLMSDFEVQGVNADLNDGTTGGHSYASIFDNTSEPSASSDPYYAPWDGSISDKKFLQPPEISEGYAVVHEGGGLIQIQKGATNHSNMRFGARGVTIYAGQKYWNAGLQGDTTHDSPAPDSTVEDDVLKIIHHTGAYIQIDANGKFSIVTADGQSYEIIGTGTGTINLGAGATHNVISDNDNTDAHILSDKIFQLPVTDMGVDPTGLIGHKHALVAGQSEVKVP